MLPTFLLHSAANDIRNLCRTVGNVPVRVRHRFKRNRQHFAPEFLLNFLQDERHVDPVAYRSRYKPQKIRQFSGGFVIGRHVCLSPFGQAETIKATMVALEENESNE
jgi:hypothetical protein